MAYSLQDTNDLTALGDAIRAKTGGNSNMTIAEMATAVAGISSGGGTVHIKNWTSTVRRNGGNYYYILNANTTGTWTGSNVPNDFWLFVPFLNNPDTSSAKYSHFYLLHFENGTTNVFYKSYSVLGDGITFTITHDSSINQATIKIKNTSSNTKLGIGTVDPGQSYMFLFYVE